MFYDLQFILFNCKSNLFLQKYTSFTGGKKKEKKITQNRKRTNPIWTYFQITNFIAVLQFFPSFWLQLSIPLFQMQLSLHVISIMHYFRKKLISYFLLAMIGGRSKVIYTILELHKILFWSFLLWSHPPASSFNDEIRISKQSHDTHTT